MIFYKYCKIKFIIKKYLFTEIKFISYYKYYYNNLYTMTYGTLTIT